MAGENIETRGILVEKVVWKGERFQQSFFWLVSNYQECFPRLGTDNWMDEVFKEFQLAREVQMLRPFTLSNPVFDLAFNGTGLENQPSVSDNLIIWREKQPELTFVDKSKNIFKDSDPLTPILLPRDRSRIYRFLGEVGEELVDVFKLEVSENSLTVRWPKREYAHEPALMRASLLSVNAA